MADQGEKLVRATELVKLLSFDKAVKGALKLATEFKLPVLAEQFNRILEERLSDESKMSVGAPNITPNGAMTSTPQPQKSSMPVSEINRAVVEPITLPHPHFSNQGKVREKVATEVLMESCKNATGGTAREGLRNLFAKTSTSQSKDEEKAKKERDMEPSKITSGQNPKLGVNQIPCKVATEGTPDAGANEKHPQRPKNPFAKTSNNQDRSSLIDSIKKMKKI